MTVALAPSPGASVALRDVLLELGDLKRVRSAGKRGSIAERHFARAWGALAAGTPARRVMRASVATALAAARLGDLDSNKLHELGLDGDAVRAVLRGAFDEMTGMLDPSLVDALSNGLDDDPPNCEPPPFVGALAVQPRAGATCPGKPRVMLEPAESHAEHCWAVAVFGVLLAPRYGADPVVVFLAGLSHHLHNAMMPDSGFTGEVLLGEHLETVVAAAAACALDELPAQVREDVAVARRILSGAETPEGRAFHAADVIDRVMELAQHLRAARFDIATLLDEWKLVHAGPVKGFHDAVLVEMGLA